MSYAKHMDSCKLGTVCYNRLVDPNNLCVDDYTCMIYRIPVECIEFDIQQPAFREYMAYAPAKGFIEPEECINPKVQSNNWWWNEHVC